MRLLFVDDEVRLVNLTLAELPREWTKFAACNLAEARRILHTNIIDVVILDLRLPDGDGLTLLDEIKQRPDPPEVFVLTGHGSVQEAVAAMRYGVYDFITKPISLDKLESVVRSGGLRRGVGTFQEMPAAFIDDFLPPGMRAVGTQTVLVARTDLPILIMGEPGVGKARFAEFIHRVSRRGNGPFVLFDCADVPTVGVEAALFGSPGRPAAVSAAEGGTLVLKNVEALAGGAQERLLELIDGRDSFGVTLDARVVATAGGALQYRIDSRLFHEGLFFKLAGFSVVLPPLRSRPGDIGYSARRQLAKEFTPSALEVLEAYDWPGNMAELTAVVQQAEGVALEAPAIQKRHIESVLALTKRAAAPDHFGPLSLEEAELAHIRRIMRLAGGNQSKAAKLLGIDPKTLYRKLKQAGVHDE